MSCSVNTLASGCFQLLHTIMVGTPPPPPPHHPELVQHYHVVPPDGSRGSFGDHQFAAYATRGWWFGGGRNLFCGVKGRHTPQSAQTRCHLGSRCHPWPYSNHFCQRGLVYHLPQAQVDGLRLGEDPSTEWHRIRSLRLDAGEKHQSA